MKKKAFSVSACCKFFYSLACLSPILELLSPVPGYNGTFLLGFLCLVLVSVHAMKVLSCREKLQSSLGMTVNGMTGLLDSRSRAVRKHSMAASFFP